MPAALWGKYRTKEYISLGHKAGDHQSSSCLDHGLFPPPVPLFHLLASVMFIRVFGWGKRWVFTSAEFACHATSSFGGVQVVQPSPTALPSHPAASVSRKNMGTGKQQPVLWPLLQGPLRAADQSLGPLKTEGNVLEISLLSYVWSDQVKNTG